MKKIIKFLYLKQQIVFLVLAIILLVFVVILAIYQFTFLISVFNKAFGIIPTSGGLKGFDVQGFENLDLIK